MVIVAMIPFFAIAFISAQVMTQQFSVMQSSTQMAQHVRLGALMTSLVHEQQKERGASAVFLGTNGAQFSDIVTRQRVLTDAAMAGVSGAISNLDFADLPLPLAKSLNDINEKTVQLPQIRAAVDGLSISTSDAVAYYSQSNGRLLGMLDTLSKMSPDGKIAVHLMALSSFLKGKENAGLERAIGGVGFAEGQFSAEGLGGFSLLIAQQKVFLDAFLAISGAENIAFFDTIAARPEFGSVENMRRMALAGQAAEIDGKQWFPVQFNTHIVMKLDKSNANDGISLDFINALMAKEAGFEAIGLPYGAGALDSAAKALA